MFTEEELSKEEWKTIEGWENYQISTLGRVRSIEREAKRKGNGSTTLDEKIMKIGTKNTENYQYVKLRKNGIAKNHFIHRLVALAFLPRIEGKDEVNLIDKNPKNCKLENLRWVNRQENACNVKRPKRRKGNERIIVAYDEKTNECIKSFNRITDIKTFLNIKTETQLREHLKDGKPYKGFYRKYKTDVQ